MRRKHHYTIKKITYKYVGSDWLEECEQIKSEKVIFETDKHEKAYLFYQNNLWQECGTELKGVYYPYVEIVFQKDY